MTTPRSPEATHRQPVSSPESAGVCPTCLGDAYLHRPTNVHERDLEWRSELEDRDPCPGCYPHPNPEEEETSMTRTWPTTESVHDLELDTRPTTPDWPAQRASSPEAPMTTTTNTNTATSTAHLIPTQQVNWDELYAQLCQPFDQRDLRYRAGAVSRDKTKAQALPYVEPRVYEDRLNQLVPGDWNVTFDPWGEHRIICRLTIHGVTRSSTGEAGDGPDGIAGTRAEARGFKRACAKFGLGRYLYAIAPTWTAYDANSRKITPPTPSVAPVRETQRIAAHLTQSADAIGPKRAAAMHRALEGAGIPRHQHNSFARLVLKHAVESLALLPAADAASVWKAADRGRHRLGGSLPQ